MSINPTSTTTGTPRQDLTPYSVFKAALSDFTWPLFLPPRFSETRNVMYPKFTAEAFSYKAPNAKRAPGGAVPMMNMAFGTAEVALQEYTIANPVDQVRAKNLSAWFDSAKLAINAAAQVVMRGIEDDAATALQGAGNTNAAGTVWSTTASATPLANVTAAVAALRGRVGTINSGAILRLGLHENAIMYALQCADVRAAISAAGMFGQIVPNLTNVKKNPAVLAQLAQIFGVDEIIPYRAQYNTAIAGQTAALSTIFDKTKAVLAIVDPNTDPMGEASPGCGHTLLCRNAYELNIDTLRQMPVDGDEYDVIGAFEYPMPGNKSIAYGAEAHAKPYVAISEAVQVITGVLS